MRALYICCSRYTNCLDLQNKSMLLMRFNYYCHTHNQQKSSQDRRKVLQLQAADVTFFLIVHHIWKGEEWKTFLASSEIFSMVHYNTLGLVNCVIWSVTIERKTVLLPLSNPFSSKNFISWENSYWLIENVKCGNGNFFLVRTSFQI